jgi:hypothetical protein
LRRSSYSNQVRFEQVLGARDPLREEFLCARHRREVRVPVISIVLPALMIQECLTVHQDFVIVPQ